MAAVRRAPRTPTYGNLAYDLDAIVRERQLEEAGTMPERRPEPEPEIQVTPRVRQHAKARPSALLMVSIVVLCAMVMALMLGFVQLTKVSTSVSEIKSELAVLNDEHVSLLTRYEQTFDLATIKETAEAAGMTKPTSAQIEYVDLSGSDVAVVYQAGSDGLLDDLIHGVGDGLAALVEYFR